MVGLSDIPCVGKVLDRISDATVDALFRGLHYMFCYKDLVDVLNSEIEKVNIQEGRVSKRAGAERDNGKTIEDHVLKWQKEVEEIQGSVKQLSEKYESRPSWRCIQCLPIPKPVSRFRLGREAVQKAKRVAELTDLGKELLANDIAYLPPVENLPKTETVFHNFESRKDAYAMLWEALLTQDSSLIIGIYGMPGVGKTRMVEQIWKEAYEKGIFDKVTRANVGSANLDLIELQKQIAGYLKCHLISKDDKNHRASQLKNSLMNGGKILIILDDVWAEIPLDIIGIPFDEGSGSKGCKIILTSREEDACLRNNCKNPIKITPLTSNEAWDLFSSTIGTGKINSLQDESLARQVCDKCGCLPLVIRAVGKALKFMPLCSWKDALDQLENCEIQSVPGIGPEVYACLKLSFDKLVEDAKSCLLLCSLFPKDAEIAINTLFRLATASQLIHGDRSRVCAMLEILKSSSLLLEGKNDELFKLHDIIRDVARSIAVRDKKYSFLFVRCGLRLPDNADYGTRKLLHLDLKRDDVHFPDDLVCPDLHNLWLQSNYHIQQFSGGFFCMFVNLKFLVLQRVCFSSQQQFSLQPLGELRTLFLDGCDITDIGQTDVSFFPNNLETLCIWDCHLPSPLDLPNLKFLKKLEIQQGIREVQMVPNAISSLSSLEELHIPTGFSIWDDATGSTPISDEIGKLTRLVSLQTLFTYFEPFQGTNIFDNLLEYNIHVGVERWPIFNRPVSRVSLTRLIELFDHPSEGLESLIEKAEQLILRYCDVKVSNICDSKRDAFADLRILYIEECATLKYLAKISKDEIQCGHHMRTSFCKLICLEIRDCAAIKYLFCNSVAKCLVQLQELCIANCPLMEVIVMNEGTSDGDIINFSKLKSLKLSDMPRLTSFYRENIDIHSNSTATMDNSAIPFQPLFDGMVAFPSLEKLEISYLDNTSDLWGKHYCNIDNVSFCQMKSLLVFGCNKLEAVIPLAMLRRLQNLEYLKVYSCCLLISEVGTYGSNKAVCPLVALREMDLEDLPCLTKTGLNSRDHSGEMTLYPNLEILKIRDCNILRNLFLASIAKDLKHLKEIHVDSCEMMREITGTDEQEISDGIVFPELKVLKLALLPNLNSFWCCQNGEANTYKVEFKKLVDFKLSCGGEINLKVIEMGRDDSTCQLLSLYINCDSEIQLPCKWQVHLYNLERLTLRHCWSHELKSLCFQRLKVLRVHSSGCSTLFVFSAFKSLQLLEELEISHCAVLEEIVDDVRVDEPCTVDNKTITLMKLKLVILTDLPSLRNIFYGANFEWHMPALKEVEVVNCGVSTLFTCSVLRNLQLEKLKVSSCRLLESIVEDAIGNVTSDTNDKMITLFRLSSIELSSLPKLKSFSCTARSTFNMPKLYIFCLDSCPQVENFTSLNIITPLLLPLYNEWQQGEEFPTRVVDTRQIQKGGSNLSDNAYESSYSNQEPETETESNEEERLQEQNKDSAGTFLLTSTTTFGKM